MWHPFQFIPAGWRRRALLIALFAATFFIGSKTNVDLRPFRIVSLEFAGTVEAAKSVIASWSAEDEKMNAAAGTMLGQARLLQWWDAFFLVAYSMTLALACVMTAEWLYQRESWAHAQGILLAWLMWLAGLLDFFENSAINRILNSAIAQAAIESRWPQQALLCAAGKFSLIAVGIWYLLSGLITASLRRHYK